MQTTRFDFLWSTAVLTVVCFLSLGLAPNQLFAQWPGESESHDTSNIWPGSNDDISQTSYPDSHKFVCTFNLATRNAAMNFLEMTESGKPRCPHQGTNYGSYFSGDRRTALTAMIRSTGVREDRIIAIEQPGFQNAGAMQCEDSDGVVKQLVIWDPQFLSELDKRAGTQWASIAVLAHELAHHHNNDTGQNPNRIPAHKRKEQELFADRWAGQKLREFGATRQQAIAVFHLMGEGGDTHPPSDLRVDAAGDGWDRGQADPPVPSHDPVPQPDRPFTPSPGVAVACYTHSGTCQMMEPIPVGSSCYCITRMGRFWGVAQ